MFRRDKQAIVGASSNEAEFNNAKPPYQEAQKNSGYSHELKYQQGSEMRGKKIEKETSRPTWENP